jgi:TonB family protein
MNTELKKNFVLSLILHAAVLACIFLVTAFAPQPRIDTTIIMDIGGPGAGGGGGEEAPPPPPEPPPKVETPQPKQEEPQKIEPARIEKPKQEDIVIPKVEKKKPVEKPKVEKKEIPKKEEVKKEDTKPKVVPSTNLVSKARVLTQSSQPKQLAKNDPRFSPDAIRSRLSKAVNSVKAGPPGAGPGTNAGPSGGGSQFGEYYSMLSSILYEAWDTPGTATPSMSTVVRVRISSDGALSFLTIVKKSGSDIMDESVVSAVVKTKKVPPPPAGLAPEVTITFQPEGA